LDVFEIVFFQQLCGIQNFKFLPKESVSCPINKTSLLLLLKNKLERFIHGQFDQVSLLFTGEAQSWTMSFAPTRLCSVNTRKY
jgi:hypothetical protein